MTERDVKIVVAEGPSGRKGLLRFVLESEGYQVVGEASSAADLGRALETHHPDVVVMDDGIGATAVGMTHDLAPAAKVILVWPEAVVPIGGDAAVEPSSVLRRLGPTVERLTGAPSATGRMGAHHGGDAAAALGLGAILAMGRAAGSTGATPADLPAAIRGDPAEPIIDARGESPVLILPESADVVPAAAESAIAGPLTFAELEAAQEDRAATPVPATGAVAAVAGVGAAAAITSGAGATDTTPGAALNRRLGTMALGGAALAGSLVLALALSGSRVPAQGVRGEGPGVQSPSAVVASPVIPPPQAVAVPGALLGDLGGSDTTLTFVTTNTVPGAGAREGAGVGSGSTGGNGGGGGPTPPVVDTGGSGGGSGSAGSGGGGGGSGGSGGSGGGSGTGGSGGGTGGGSSFGGGGKGGGGECVPGDGGNASPPCGTDDDGLDEHGHGDHRGGHHHGDGGDPADDSHGHDGDHHGSDDHGDHGHGSDHHGDDHGDHGHGDHGHGDHHGGDHGGYGH